MVNFHPKEDLELTLELRGMEVEQFSGSILTAEALNAHNTFENATQVKVEEFKDGELVDASLQVTLPAKSVVTLAFE
jgi:alpha-N-arabinofuranosidase